VDWYATLRGTAAGCLAMLACQYFSARGAAGEPGNVGRCLSIAANLDLGAPLERTRTRLQAGGPITIVALGSSSTSGYGTLGPGYPEVMKAELLRRRPSLRVDVINSGRALDTLEGNLLRLDDDVLRYKPDLVVWQLGTNDVVFRGIMPHAKRSLAEGVRKLKEADADVILMDIQDAPVVRIRPARTAKMETLIASVAREEEAGLFPRYLLMQRAQASGVGGLVALDGLHNSGDGYRCIGQALARMIDAR
jgi:acyl-CoA thioesterase-1